MKTVSALRALAVGTAACAMAFANAALAVDVTPASGLWIIDEENNGAPGRGFQLDTQNATLVLTFYGYDGLGDAAWWLASGAFAAGSNELTMDLGAYEGGMAFGDPPKDATYLGSDGTVTIRFDSVTSGEICLPAEPCKSISVFTFGWPDSAAELLGSWMVSGTYLDGRPYGIDATFTEVLPSLGPAVVDRVRGTATLDAEGIPVTAPVVCSKLVNPDEYEYLCSVALPDGSSLEFKMDTYRQQTVEGEASQGGIVIGDFIGFRTATADGRIVR
jgi:hypothetical protein